MVSPASLFVCAARSEGGAHLRTSSSAPARRVRMLHATSMRPACGSAMASTPSTPPPRSETALAIALASLRANHRGFASHCSQCAAHAASHRPPCRPVTSLTPEVPSLECHVEVGDPRRRPNGRDAQPGMSLGRARITCNTGTLFGGGPLPHTGGRASKVAQLPADVPQQPAVPVAAESHKGNHAPAWVHTKHLQGPMTHREACP